MPNPWDGTADDLPSGWDEAFLRAYESGREPDVLSALAISVRPDRQSQGLARRMLEEMRGAAATGGLRELIAPVRPTLKARYPLIPIEQYMEWRRPDGSHFDPWIRVHERIGGEILAPAPESMVMDNPVPDWEEWTGMQFPADGDYAGYGTGSSGACPCGPARAGGAFGGSARCSRSGRQSRRGRPGARKR